MFKILGTLIALALLAVTVIFAIAAAAAGVYEAILGAAGQFAAHVFCRIYLRS